MFSGNFECFHAGAAATGNARSPTVNSRIYGTSNHEIDSNSIYWFTVV